MGLTAEVVLGRIHSLLENFPEVELQVQEAASSPVSYCGVDHPLLEAIAKNAEEVTGRRPLAVRSLGATDWKFWRYLGVPACTFGVSPKGMAGLDDPVAVEEFLETVKVHAAAVWYYMGGPA
jgi:acetylornithine deacetylase/succinyl-diaminopimelate desuccinylase-like protein